MRQGNNRHDEEIKQLQARISYLEAKLACNESETPLDLDGLLNGARNLLTREAIKRETNRLLLVCAREGVGAILKEAAYCRALLHSLANACHLANLKEAGQYLDYLEIPYD